MYQFEGDKKRKSVIQLQLAPMIDIFVLIIVFLLKGTVLEESAIILPEGVNLAKSISRETSQVAPQVVISKDTVSFKMVNQERPIAEFNADDFNPRDKIFQEFKDYLLLNREVEGADHINVISDSTISYKAVYNVVKVLRIAGFQSMLFVAEGEGN